MRLMTQKQYWQLEVFMAEIEGGSEPLFKGRIERVPPDWLRCIILDASVPQN